MKVNRNPGLAVLAAGAALVCAAAGAGTAAAGAGATWGVGVTNNTRYALTATVTAYDAAKSTTQTFSRSIGPATAYLFRLPDGVRPIQLRGALTIAGEQTPVPGVCINGTSAACNGNGYESDTSWMLRGSGSDYAFTTFPGR